MASLRDDEIAKLVNDLRDVAIKYYNTQQLRERISRLVCDALKKTGPYYKDDFPDDYEV